MYGPRSDKLVPFESMPYEPLSLNYEAVVKGKKDKFEPYCICGLPYVLGDSGMKAPGNQNSFQRRLTIQNLHSVYIIDHKDQIIKPPPPEEYNLNLPPFFAELVEAAHLRDVREARKHSRFPVESVSHPITFSAATSGKALKPAVSIGLGEGASSLKQDKRTVDQPKQTTASDKPDLNHLNQGTTPQSSQTDHTKSTDNPSSQETCVNVEGRVEGGVEDGSVNGGMEGGLVEGGMKEVVKGGMDCGAEAADVTDSLTDESGEVSDEVMNGGKVSEDVSLTDETGEVSDDVMDKGKVSEDVKRALELQPSEETVSRPRIKRMRVISASSEDSNSPFALPSIKQSQTGARNMLPPFHVLASPPRDPLLSTQVPAPEHFTPVPTPSTAGNKMFNSSSKYIDGFERGDIHDSSKTSATKECGRIFFYLTPVYYESKSFYYCYWIRFLFSERSS